MCVQYMYAQDGDLREKILIKQGHPRLSITKTLLLMGIFSSYMLENIKVKQLLCKGCFEFVLWTVLTQRSKWHFVFTASKICPKGCSKGTRCFLLCALLCQGWSEYVFWLCFTSASEAQLCLLRVGKFWLGLSCLSVAAALAGPSKGWWS